MRSVIKRYWWFSSYWVLCFLFAIAYVGDIQANKLTQAIKQEPGVSSHYDKLEPIFSHGSGVYTDDFDLRLEHPDPDVEIYFTLDGSVPDPDNLNGNSFRYKNYYQQPPAFGSSSVIVNNDFLTRHYQTFRYQQPIPIIDRTSEPDRLSQISTTFDANPDYFPEPVTEDHWINNTVALINRLIKEANRGVLRLNRYFNRLRQNFTSGADAAAFVTYVPDIPFIGYRKYKQPLQYTFKGTAVRALAVKNINGERIIGPVVSKTYFVGSRHQTQLPIIAVYIPEKSLFDYDEGILVAGVDYDEWLSSDEASEKVGVFSYPANWKRRENNRAAAQFEVLPATGASSKLFETELRSHGNTSRAFANKSLRLYPKSTVDFPIFTGQPPTEKLRINLRLERRARLYDDVAHAVLHGLAFASQRSEPYLVFINGEFYSVLNARDRRDATFLREFYNLKNKKVDFLSFEPNRNEDSDGRNRSAKKGDFAAWDDLIAQTYENPSLSLEAIQEFIDIESLSDYYIAEIYSANKDWPGNNNSFWRFADEKNKTKSGASDGRWRWYLYDLDDAFQEPQLNALERIIRPSHANNPDYPAYILNRLLEDASFEQYFITRFLDLINTTFVPQRVISLIDAAEASLEVDIPWQIQRWNTPRSVAVWKDSIQTMRDFALKRAEIQRQQLRDFFELAEPYRVTVDVALKNGAGIELAQAPGSIKLNTLTLGVLDSELALPVAASHKPKAITPYLSLPWSGQYFQAMPLEIAAEARPGYRFAYWQGTVPDALRLQPIITLSPTNDVRLTAVFEKDE